MTTPHPALSRGETWTRSVAGRIAISAVVAVAISLLAAGLNGMTESAASRGTSFLSHFLRSFATLGIWALAFEPLYQLVRWLPRRLPGPVLPLLVHAALSLGFAWVLSSAHWTVLGWLGQTPSAPQSAGARPGSQPRPAPPGDGPHTPGDPTRPFRMAFGIGMYWALVAGAWGLSNDQLRRERERQRAEEALHRSQLQADLAQAQLDNLRAQLNPHFLFNALNSVGGLIRQGRPQPALEALEGLGSLLRTLLEERNHAWVPLAAEFEIVDRYAGVEQVRFGDRMRLETRMGADVAGLKVPNLILLPLVENAVKHAVASQSAGGTVSVSARRVGDSLELEVADNGPGLTPQVLQSGGANPGTTNIGLPSTRDRLKLLYGDRAQLRLENAGGARVTLVLPIDGGSPA
ncbi:MAG: histidine kinase [Planctomycetota bacterium]